MPMYMCAALRGSMRIECSFGPSGVPSLSSPHHALRCGCSLKPSTPRHVAPPSSERNNPCGEVPAYQTPGCDTWPGRQPERVIDDTAAAFAKRWRLFCFVPGTPAILRAENRRAEMTCPRGGEHRLAVTRIGDAMMHDVAEELRPGEAPGATRCIGVHLPKPLARRNEQGKPAFAGCFFRLRHSAPLTGSAIADCRRYAFTPTTTRLPLHSSSAAQTRFSATIIDRLTDPH